MATLTVFAGKDINMEEPPSALDWDVETAGSAQWSLSDPTHHLQDYFGTGFSYTEDQLGLTGGTLTRIDFRFLAEQGTEDVMRIADFSLDVAASLGTLDPNDMPAYLSLIFNGKDTMNDSESSDLLHGYTGADHLFGNGGSDTLKGDDGNDWIYGGDGADTLVGGKGRDVLLGGAGDDKLTGGNGQDQFRFASDITQAGKDTIKDFSLADDSIALDNDFFAHCGTSGIPIAENKFIKSAHMTATKTVSADVRVLYDTDSGRLFYDSDGGDGENRFLIAVLTDAPDLNRLHIAIVA